MAFRSLACIFHSSYILILYVFSHHSIDDVSSHKLHGVSEHACMDGVVFSVIWFHLKHTQLQLYIEFQKINIL